MSSQWITIDRLGLKGMEPDLMPVHREPNSLDVGFNVRAIGPNIGAAGGYLEIGAIPASAPIIPPLSPPLTVPIGSYGPLSACLEGRAPNEHLRMERDDGTYYIHRAYAYNWGDPKDYIVLFPVNYEGNPYDLTFRAPRTGLDPGYQGGVQVRAVNTSGTHRLYVESLADDGSVSTTELDYDASARWSAGTLDWVIIRIDGTAMTVHLGNTEIYNGTSTVDMDEYICAWTLANHASQWYIPLCVWQYNQEVFDCLTGGTLQSLAGLPALNFNPTYRYDPDKSSDSDIVTWDNLISIGKTAVATPRTSFLKESLSGLRYWEVVAVSGTMRSGIAKTNVNDQALGEYIGSMAFDKAASKIRVSGYDYDITGTLGDVVVFVCDFSTGNLWIGYNVTGYHQDGAQIQTWFGDRNIYEGDAAALNLYSTPNGTNTYTPQLALQRADDTVRYELFSTPKSCTFAPPQGFNYL